MNHILYKNIKISYSESGKGNPVVLLHGYLENLSMWDYHVAVLKNHHKVICIDLLGHGQTGCIGYIHTMEDMADAVYAVLNELQIKKAAFIGHSMGGYVALALSELYPECIKSLVLLNSTAKADSEERRQNRDRAIRAVKKDFVIFIRMSIVNLFSEDNRERLDTEIEFVKQEALQTPLQGIIAALEGMKIRKNRESILHFANYPILLILGKKDPVLNNEETTSQIEGTNIKLATFPDGHMSHIENREELKILLTDFLKEN